MEMNNRNHFITLSNELTEQNDVSPPVNKLVTSRFTYEKYDKNINNRPDYEYNHLIMSICWLHYLVLSLEVLTLIIIIIVIGAESKTGNDNKKTSQGSSFGSWMFIFIYFIIIPFVVFTLIPYSIKYKISFSQKLFTYQYMSFFPNIFPKNATKINIEDAIYFREELTLNQNKFLLVRIYFVKLMKKNKNNEEVEVIYFGRIGGDPDLTKKFVFVAQKMARLLNEMIGFDINLIKNIKKAYINNDSESLQKISNEMSPDKKVLIQNLFDKMNVNIKI